MQSDRELLELAAKAAGIDYNPRESFPKDPIKTFFGLWLNIKCEPDEGQRRRWNPLTDDGDALRLAVKLEILVLTARGFAVANATDSGGTLERLPSEPDPNAATRRAITRAAASQMEKGTP